MKNLKSTSKLQKATAALRARGIAVGPASRSPSVAPWVMTAFGAGDGFRDSTQQSTRRGRVDVPDRELLGVAASVVNRMVTPGEEVILHKTGGKYRVQARGLLLRMGTRSLVRSSGGEVILGQRLGQELELPAAVFWSAYATPGPLTFTLEVRFKPARILAYGAHESEVARLSELAKGAARGVATLVGCANEISFR